MGTRGLYGIRRGNVDKCAYNHYDSYPDCLGSKILYFCARHSEEQISKLFDLIELFDTSVPPTEQQKRMCKQNGYVDLNVSTRSDDDWYCLLRNLEGDIDVWELVIQEESKIPMENSIDFIKDSLFCEYAYIINLDTHMLEYWLGFQEKSNSDNRYGYEQRDGYYPCRLALEIPLNRINISNIREWVKEMEGINEKEY